VPLGKYFFKGMHDVMANPLLFSCQSGSEPGTRRRPAFRRELGSGGTISVQGWFRELPNVSVLYDVSECYGYLPVPDDSISESHRLDYRLSNWLQGLKYLRDSYS